MSLPHQLVAIPALLSTLVLAAGCGDGNSPEGDFRFSGVLAGTVWVGDADALLVSGADDGDTLYVIGTRPVNAGQLPQDILTVRVPFEGAGSYQLTGNEVDLKVLTGGDVVSASYNGRSPIAGTLMVQSYDAVSGLITGTVAFEASSSSELQPYGAAPRFQDGRFRATVRQSAAF